MSAPSGSMDAVSKLTNLLPTGTFLAFQTVAPIFTNNGKCGQIEKIMTGILLLFVAIICWVLNFTDSLTTDTGTVYYGIVTKRGLFNPRFKSYPIAGVQGYFYYGDKYVVNGFDFINGVFDIIALGALTLLTPPITTCYYPNIPSTIVKTLPILVAIVVGSYFAFAPPPRNGIGFPGNENREVAHDSPRSRQGSSADDDNNKQSLLKPEGPYGSRALTVSSPGRTTV